MYTTVPASSLPQFSDLWLVELLGMCLKTQLRSSHHGVLLLVWYKGWLLSTENILLRNCKENEVSDLSWVTCWSNKLLLLLTLKEVCKNLTVYMPRVCNDLKWYSWTTALHFQPNQLKGHFYISLWKYKPGWLKAFYCKILIWGEKLYSDTSRRRTLLLHIGDCWFVKDEEMKTKSVGKEMYLMSLAYSLAKFWSMFSLPHSCSLPPLYSKHPEILDSFLRAYHFYMLCRWYTLGRYWSQLVHTLMWRTIILACFFMDSYAGYKHKDEKDVVLLIHRHIWET